MVRRLVQALVALGMVVPVLAPALQAQAGPGDRAAWLSAPRWFSPNADGVQDTAVVRFSLAKPADRITLTFRTGRAGWADTVRRVVLTDLDAGRHTWTWNGRDGKRRAVDDAEYTVILKGGPGVTASDRTEVDTTFAPDLFPATTYGASEDATPTVWPRSTAVTDSLGLVADLNQRSYLVGSPVRRARLEIRDRSGRLVLLRGVNRTIDTGYGPRGGREIGWTARRAGKPLPRGRYVARVVGGDQVGNRGRSAPLRIWVSGDRLEWQERTVTVMPAGSTARDYCFGNGCGEMVPCGTVVPSERFSEGLSYRSAECASRFTYPRATQLHSLPVLDAAGVRGIQRARVGFTGTPTVDGETDLGELRLSTTSAPDASVTSSTGGRTPWSDHLSAGVERLVDGDDGDQLTLPPQVLWTFTTHGSDSVDVDRFTVDYSFLAPAR
jgi:hypothetical protein